jgi:hypothetical protein
MICYKANPSRALDSVCSSEFLAHAEARRRNHAQVPSVVGPRDTCGRTATIQKFRNSKEFASTERPPLIIEMVAPTSGDRGKWG